MTEITDEDIEHLKHQDFKKKNHKEGCTCGYCELKRWEKEQQLLRTEFNKRTKSLKLDRQAKEELYDSFIETWDNGFRCVYCRKRMELKFENELSFTIDHYLAKSKGGQDIQHNLVFCCRSCNFLKGNMDAEKYLNNMERLIARKKKNEHWKAKNSSRRDEPKREAYKDILERVNAKKEVGIKRW